MQHIFWDERNEIEKYLKTIDESIKKLVDTMKPDIKIVMSDHGFHKRSTKYFHINTWLKKYNYLEIKESVSIHLKNFAYSCRAHRK